MSDSSRGALVVVIIVVVVAVLYVMWGGGGGGSQGTQSVGSRPVIPDSSPMKMNETAPDFTYTTIDGREIRLSGYIGEKPVVLDFWGTTCGPCLLELPKLQQLYAGHSGEVEIIAITSESRNNAGRVADVANEKNLTFPVMHDPSRAISRLYPSQYIPYLVFIDKDGIVIDTVVGYNPKVGEEILETFGL